MTALNCTLFDAKKPLETFFHFTRCYKGLSKEKQRAFFEAAQEFFSESAWNGKTIRCKEGFAERFCSLDFPNLKEVMVDAGLANPKYQIRRLVANIAKVTSQNFSEVEKKLSVYQILVPVAGIEKTSDIWGWIPAKYVLSSDELQKSSDGNGVIICDGVKPSVLVALQRLSSMLGDKSKMDFSCDCLFELYQFGLEWEIEVLLNEVNTIVNKMDTPKRFEALLAELGEEVLEEFKERKKSLGEEQKITKVELITHEEEAQGSEKFDPKKPYVSIAKFTERLCTLSITQQQAFFSSVRDFFTHAYYCQQKFSVPKGFKERFAKLDLPFLVDSMQFTQNKERRRFVSNVQRVTGLHFYTLRVQDQVYCTETTTIVKNLKWMDASVVEASNLLGHQPADEERQRGYAEGKYIKIELPKYLHGIKFTSKGLQKLESFEQYLDFFALAYDLGIDPWINAACEAFTHVLGDDEKEADTLLALHLDNIYVVQYLEGIETLNPYVSRLSRSQTQSVFNFNLEKQNLARAIQAIEGSRYFWKILTEYKSSAELEHVVKIEAYFLSKLLEKFPDEKLKTFVNDLFNYLKESVKTEEKRRNKFSFESGYNCKDLSKCLDVFKILTSNEIDTLFAEAGYIEVGAYLVDGMETLIGEKIAEDFKKEFDVKYDFKPIVDEMMLTLFRYGGEKESPDFSTLAERHSLYQWNIDEFAKVLFKEEVGTWFVKYFEGKDPLTLFRGFSKAYSVSEEIKRLPIIRDEVFEEFSDQQRLAGYLWKALYEICISPYYIDGENFSSFVEYHLVKGDLTFDEGSRLIAFFEKKEKSLFCNEFLEKVQNKLLGHFKSLQENELEANNFVKEYGAELDSENKAYLTALYRLVYQMGIKDKYSLERELDGYLKPSKEQQKFLYAVIDKNSSSKIYSDLFAAFKKLHPKVEEEVTIDRLGEALNDSPYKNFILNVINKINNWGKSILSEEKGKEEYVKLAISNIKWLVDDHKIKVEDKQKIKDLLTKDSIQSCFSVETLELSRKFLIKHLFCA